jgi:hypothetical protein
MANDAWMACRSASGDSHASRSHLSSRLGRPSGGMNHLTRRRVLSRATDMALGWYAASPLLAGCTEAAPVAPVRTSPAAPSRGRAPFQIMALKDYAVPPNLQALRVPDARDRPFSGSYGQPHIMSRSLVAFAYDAALLYDGDATPPWSPPDLESLEAHIYGGAIWNLRGPEFNGVLCINGEGDHWHEVDAKGDNAWNAVNTPEGVDRAVPICVSWVEALRQVCPKALMAWYDKPSGAIYVRSLDYLKQFAPRQAALLEALDILSPSLYIWHEAYPDGFDRAVGRFRDKLAWIRDTYPNKLLCPTAWEEFYMVGSSHDRGAGQECPAQSGRNRYWATVPAYSGKSGKATCTQPAFSRAQWDSLLDMLYAVGCDGVFYWASTNSWGKYFTDADAPGIRGLLALAERLNGATPQGPHTATFYLDRGPFAG